jgi:predicted RNase H-like HicB family nuclease
VNSMIYKVVVTPDPEDGGFTVSCPAISGCHSEGETIEEALENIKDAIQGCIGVLNERASRQQGSTVIDVSV